MLIALATAVAACDPVTGTGNGSAASALWFHADAAGATGIPYADADLVVYATFDDTRLVALDARSGRKRWEHRLAIPAEFGHLPTRLTIVAYGDLLLVSAWDLFALDRSTGSVRWVLRVPDDFAATGYMALADGSVYSTGRRLYRIDAATGRVLWKNDLDGEQPFGPVVADGVVYVGTRLPVQGVLGAGHAVALRTDDGSELWRFPLPDADDANWHGGAAAPGALTNDLFIVASANGRVYGIDRTSGAQRWMHRGGLHFYGGVVVVDSVAIATNDHVQGVDVRSGRQLWRRSVANAVDIPMAVVGGSALLSQSSVTAWDTSGRRLWMYVLDQQGRDVFSTAPAVHDRTVYVGSYRGMHAIRLPDEVR